MVSTVVIVTLTITPRTKEKLKDFLSSLRMDIQNRAMAIVFDVLPETEERRALRSLIEVAMAHAEKSESSKCEEVLRSTSTSTPPFDLQEVLKPISDRSRGLQEVSDE